MESRLNETSIESVRNMIAMKNSPNVFMATGNAIKSSVTDMDHHPYSRWWRGVYYYSDPIVMEREAGTRMTRNGCYGAQFQAQIEQEPLLCFETPCTTTLPCFRKPEDRELTALINSKCMAPYY